MSIILDALKKSQDDIKKDNSTDDLHAKRQVSLEAKIPVEAASPSSNRWPFIIFLLATFLALTAYGMRQFFTRSSPKDIPKAAVVKEGLAQTPSRREIIYKPKSEEAEAIPKREYPEFILNGIMYLRDAPQAIINGSIVEEGEIIGGAKVVKIAKDSVVLNFEGVEMLLNLK